MFRVRGAITAGDLDARSAAALCDLAQRFGSGEVRMTFRHEVEVVCVPERDVPAVESGLKRSGLRVDDVLNRPNVVACPGADHCTSAFVETKRLCREVEAYLIEAELAHVLPPEFRVGISGCPNECSQARINDVGFVGSVGVYGGRKLKGFELVVGGCTAGEGRLCERIAFVTERDVVPTLRDVIEIYCECAVEGTPFAKFYFTVGQEDLTNMLHDKLTQRMWFFEI